MFLVILKRFATLLILLLIAPFILVFGPPVALCVLFLEAVSRGNGRFSSRSFPVQVFTVVMILIIFAFGLGLDIIVVPLAIVIGVPALIGFTIYERIDKIRRAKERLRERMQEAQQI